MLSTTSLAILRVTCLATLTSAAALNGPAQPQKSSRRTFLAGVAATPLLVAGPLKSRAASAISDKPKGAKTFIEVGIDYCKANAPLPKDLTSDDVGSSAAFLCSPLSGAVTGMTVYVDNGMHAMGMVQEVAVAQVAEN